jgi:hypothetical protein
MAADAGDRDAAGDPTSATATDSAPDRRRALRAWLRPRLRLVATGILAGAGLGVVLALALTLLYDPTFAARKGFGLGLLAFGFGVLGWSGSALAGPGIENMQRHLDTGSDWSEADSRRAMARVASAGFGVALLVPPVAGVLGG